MDTTLAAINPYLAKAVLLFAATFSGAVTLLATLTSEPNLLIGTAFGVVAGGYAMQVLRPQRVELTAQRAEPVRLDA